MICKCINKYYFFTEGVNYEYVIDGKLVYVLYNEKLYGRYKESFRLDDGALNPIFFDYFIDVTRDVAIDSVLE